MIKRNMCEMFGQSRWKLKIPDIQPLWTVSVSWIYKCIQKFFPYVTLSRVLRRDNWDSHSKAISSRTFNIPDKQLEQFD